MPQRICGRRTRRRTKPPRSIFNQYTAAQGEIAESYQTLSGKLAVDGYTATEKQLAVLKRDYLSRAANPEQAELLSRAIEAGSLTTLGRMQRYRDQQQGVYEDEVSTTRIGQLLNNVRRFYNDDREYAKGVYLAQVESLDQLRRHNAGTEEIKAKLKQVASTGMRQRIEGAMAQSDLGLARRLFDGHADSLLAPDREAIAAQLGHLEFNSRVENETARILQASPLRLGGEQHGKTATEPNPPDAEGRLALAEKIADPELRQSVKDRIAAQNIRDRQTYLNLQRQLKGQAKDVIDRGGSFTDIPYQMLIGIDAKGKAALSTYARAGGTVKTDPVAYYGLKNLALDDPKAYSDVDLNDHLGEIGAGDLATLDQLQQSLRSGNHDPQIDLERVYKGNIDRTLRGLDLSATDIANIHRQVDRDLAGYQAATGRKATPAEQQQMADQAVIDMKRDQRSFAMTRYGGIISTTGGAADANDNSLDIQTAAGDIQLADGTESKQAQDEGSLKNLFEGQIPLIAEPELPDQYVPPMRDDALGQWKAEVWPVPGHYTLNEKEPKSRQGAGYFEARQGRHKGIDIHAPLGSRVVAASSGVIVEISPNPSKSYGYQVVIDHGNGIFTQYAHLDATITLKNGKKEIAFKDENGNLVMLRAGQEVRAGQQIGVVGKTGNAAGVRDAHLHFEVRQGSSRPVSGGGHVVDPTRHLPRYPQRRSMSSETIWK